MEQVILLLYLYFYLEFQKIRAFWEFINTPLVSNLLGGLVVGFIVFSLTRSTEDKLRREKSENLTLRLLTGLAGDLHWDLFVAKALIKDKDTYTSKNKSPFIDYNTKGIENFLYERPIKEFPYKDLHNLYYQVNLDNNFLKHIRRTGLKENKEIVCSNATSVEEQVEKLLEKLEKFSPQ